MAGDLYYDNVSLLLHCDGTDGSTTFTDHSPTPKTVTAYGNAHIETDQSKFGGTSAYFDGANDGLMLADLALGTDDFTIEMWVKTSSSVQYAQLIGNEPGFTLLVNHASSTSGNFALYVPGGLLLTSVSGDWNDGAWHHIALVRLVNTFTLYTDGNANGTGTYTGSLSGSNLWLGRNNVYTPRNLVGYLDDIRITKGVARYTANFTPPTEAFANYGSNFAYFAFAALAPYLQGQIETVLFGLQAFGLACAPILAPPTSLALAAYPVELDGFLLPAAIEFRHLPLIPWIMPMTSPVYPPGVTATLTNPTPGVSIRGLWSPADVLFGWSYDSGTDTISFPLASLFELTAAQADPATGDWRAILLAMSNTLWDAYIELDTAPQAMVLEYNPGYMMTAGPMVNTVKAEYTATVYLTFPEKFIADEP